MNPVTVILVLALVLVCIAGVKSYLKRLRSGCCGGGDGPEKRVKAADRDPSHYPYSADVQVEGMTCANCVRRVENAFHRQTGLLARADLEAGCVHVFMKEQRDDDTLRALVSQAGYLPGRVSRPSQV